MRVPAELFQRFEARLERDIAPRVMVWFHKGEDLLAAARQRDLLENFRRSQLWAQHQVAALAAALRALVAWWEQLITRYFALLQLHSGMTAVQRALPF